MTTPRPFLRRGPLPTALAVAATVALGLAGCARTMPGTTVSASAGAPSASASSTSSGPASASASGSPSQTASGSTPSPSGTSGPSVNATGSLRLHSEASTKLTGSCRTVNSVPTIAVADRSNEFFNTVDAVLTLSSDKAEVATLTIELGEDQELITRTLDYRAAAPATGTTASLSVKGARYTVSGKAGNTEDGRAAGTMPVTLTLTCASGNW